MTATVPESSPTDEARRAELAQALADVNRDLGFGTIVATESRKRLLNRDGSFNVVRAGLPPLASLSLYHSILAISWPAYLGLIAATYLVANAVFATGYLLCGPGALDGTSATSLGGRFLESFFFSVQTLATIGYGHVSPISIAAELLVTVESLAGLLGFALATGLLFARVARPTARILFSEHAVIAPYRGGTAFEFRIANGRSNQLIDVAARVLFTWVPRGNSTGRQFAELQLERRNVTFFPLTWTVVHPIDEKSPLRGLTPDDLASLNVEFLVLLTGTDETFSQAVHARSSYKGDEIVWGARFSSIYTPPTEEGDITVDVGHLDAIERVPL